MLTMSDFYLGQNFLGHKKSIHCPIGHPLQVTHNKTNFGTGQYVSIFQLTCWVATDQLLSCLVQFKQRSNLNSVILPPAAMVKDHTIIDINLLRWWIECDLVEITQGSLKKSWKIMSRQAEGESRHDLAWLPEGHFNHITRDLPSATGWYLIYTMTNIDLEFRTVWFRIQITL